MQAPPRPDVHLDDGSRCKWYASQHSYVCLLCSREAFPLQATECGHLSSPKHKSRCANTEPEAIAQWQLSTERELDRRERAPTGLDSSNSPLRKEAREPGTEARGRARTPRNQKRRGSPRSNGPPERQLDHATRTDRDGAPSDGDWAMAEMGGVLMEVTDEALSASLGELRLQ